MGNLMIVQKVRQVARAFVFQVTKNGDRFHGKSGMSEMVVAGALF
jgi:hypothetical protein